MKIRTAGYRIAISPDKLEDYTSGGIALVHNDHEKAGVQTGTILGIGEYAWRAFDRDEVGRPIGKPWAKVGDRIVYSQYAARRYTDKDTETEIAFLNDEDVIAVLEESS